MSKEITPAVQFNGGNFGYIYDWISGKTGLYPACFQNEMEVNGTTVHRNDWVVKNEDGSFEIMTNMEFQNKMDKEYAKGTY
jgi:hypothetical protein